MLYNLEKELNHRCYYHGTTTAGITKLQADPIVYLTPIRTYALFYIIDKSINWFTCAVKEDGTVYYEERFPNQLKKLYSGKSGYIHKCNYKESFTSGKSRGIVVSRSPIDVIDFEFIPDVYQEILNYEKTGAVVVKRYEDLSDTEKEDVFDMMVNYIYKNNLLEAKGPKATFVRESFPDSWAYAAAHVGEKSRIMEEWKKRMEK